MASFLPWRRPLSPRRPSFPHLGGHGAPCPPSTIITAELSPVLVALELRAPQLTTGSNPEGWNRPAQASLPYVANVCFRCFSRFKGMLQLFLMNVAKVDWGMLHILQAFQKHVANICSKCFIYFQTYVAIFFIWLLHMFSPYAATVCSKYFNCFSLMLR
jgi:hypothetical protein